MSSYDEIKRSYLRKKEENENPGLVEERKKYEPIAEKFVEDFKNNAHNGVNETKFTTSPSEQSQKAHEYIQKRFQEDDLKGFVPKTDTHFAHNYAVGDFKKIMITTVKVEDDNYNDED